MRKQLVKEFAPLRKNALEKHPWRAWAGRRLNRAACPAAIAAGVQARILSWSRLRIERVCESSTIIWKLPVSPPARILRWRPDKKPKECRYDQLEVTPAYELKKVFGGARA